jgi:hypothetical protein
MHGRDRHRATRWIDLVARDHLGREAGPFHRLGQLHDFQRAGPVGEAADEAPFLERGDQPVDPRLRPQIQRILHFVERWRHTIPVHPGLDEVEKFQLLACQHVQAPHSVC